MVIADSFLEILPFLFIILAVVGDARFGVAMYMFAAITALLGVAFPILTTASVTTTWLGMTYLALGITSGFMSVFSLLEYEPQRRG